MPLPPTRFCSYIFAVVGTLPARGPVACELLTLSKESNSCARSTVPLRVTAPVPFLSTSTSCVPPRASDTVACHASRERESAEVAKVELPALRFTASEVHAPSIFENYLERMKRRSECRSEMVHSFRHVGQ